MSSPESNPESAAVTLPHTPAGESEDEEQQQSALPERLQTLLRQSGIYSKIIADKLARDTAERQKRDAKAGKREERKEARRANRDAQATGRDTRSGRAGEAAADVVAGKKNAGAASSKSTGSKRAKREPSILSSQSGSDADEDDNVKARDFEQQLPDGDSSRTKTTRSTRSSDAGGKSGSSTRSRVNGKAATPAKQVAAAVGLSSNGTSNGKASVESQKTAAAKASNGRVSRAKSGRGKQPVESESESGEDVEEPEDKGDGPKSAKKEDEEGENGYADGDDNDNDDEEGEEESHDQEAKSRQPRLVTGATMKSYQLSGMEWLISLYENGLNGILADEMGLGKTLQTISLLAYLRDKGVWGPFLVCCPLSTLANWVNEFERFTPDIPVVMYHGTPEERDRIRDDEMRMPVDLVKGKRAEVKPTKRGTYQFNTTQTFPVIITSYDIVMRDRKHLAKYDWKYLIIDESHRIKNLNCKLIQELMSYKSANRLLLTGTPLQNNLAELWSLLNFLMPEIFDDLDAFKSWFDIDVTSDDTASMQIVTKLHAILKPFLLRRVKRDVEKSLPPKKEYLLSAALTAEQKKLYDAVIKRQIREFLISRKDLLPDADSAKNAFSSDDESVPAKPGKKKGKGKSVGGGKKRKANGAAAEQNGGEDPDVAESEDAPKAKRARPNYAEQSDAAFLKSLEEGKEREKAEEFEKQRYAHIYGNGNDDDDELGVKTKKVNQLKLQNMMMQLRKVCNHPWLFEWPMNAKTGEYIVDKRIIQSSGKMLLLDRLLTELFRTGHKCLVFSQFTSQLDIIQDWAEEYKEWPTMRIDGNTKQDERRVQLKEFNEQHGPKSTHLFLLSTRSGGVGINLTGADTVILYDSDWNPQMDLQAMDRVHRLGQTKPVLIFRLVTANTIESKMLERAGAKRKLEALVIGSGKYTTSLEDLQDIFTGNTSRANKDERGAGLAAQMFAEEMRGAEQGKEIRVISHGEEAISDETLEMLLDRSDEAMARGKGWKADEGSKAMEVIETIGAGIGEEGGEGGEEDALADYFHAENSMPPSPITDE